MNGRRRLFCPRTRGDGPSGASKKRTSKKTTRRKKTSRRVAVDHQSLDFSVGIGDVIPPFLPRRSPSVGNLFASGRAGDAVVRPEDLLALRIERRNLKLEAGSPPRLVKSGSGAGYLILHFPPQAITEETFFEAEPNYEQKSELGADVQELFPEDDPTEEADPDNSEELREPPIKARIAGESRLVFKVPNDFDIPYTLEGVLDACLGLGPNVAANARPPGPRRARPLPPLRIEANALARLAPWLRATLASQTIRNTRLASARHHDPSTLNLRSLGGGLAIRPSPRFVFPEIERAPLATGPRPALPSATKTAIELPWRLIISPHADERWRHAAAPVTSAATGHTELWHSRLVAPDADGNEIEPPDADPRRTIRAVWALTGENSTHAMKSVWPDPAEDIPNPSTLPFRMPLDDFDRFQFVHLSSNFSVSGYHPEAVDANLLMLSALGGWLDSRGAWDPPGLSVEEWVHRASMARDHYVRVVYRGFLFPLGHRVSLVKVSERKFHNGGQTQEQEPGNPAYLRQRLFIIVRERERDFGDPAYANLKTKDGRHYLRQFPFSRVRMLTQVTPNLDKPDSLNSSIEPFGQRMFWPCVNESPFRFQCVGTDLDGRPVAFDLPLIFMDNTLACPRRLNPQTNRLDAAFGEAEVNAGMAREAYLDKSNRRTVPFKRQRVALAPSARPGDTAVEVDEIVFDGETEVNNSALQAASGDLMRPMFMPRVETFEARIGPLAHLAGADKTNRLKWHLHYLEHGFQDNPGEVFADVEAVPGMALLDFSAQGDRSGGYVQPNLRPEGLSRFAGPVMGDIEAFRAGTVPDGGGFPKLPGELSMSLPMPLLFGCIPLGDLIPALGNLTSAPERIPKFVSEAASPLESFLSELGRLYGLATDLAAQPGGIAAGAIAAFQATLDDHMAQAQAYPAAQMAPLQTAKAQLANALNDVAGSVQDLVGQAVDAAAIGAPLAALPGEIAQARARVADLKDAANAQTDGAFLPSGLRQLVLSSAQQLDGFLADLEKLPVLVDQAKILFESLDDIFGQPETLAGLLSDPPLFQTRTDAVSGALGSLKTTLSGFKLMDGAPRKQVIGVIDAVAQVIGVAQTLVESLGGDELTIRFDWNPEIRDWSLPGSNSPIFRANDKRGFVVAVEAKVKKSGASTPKITVLCSLKHFDLVLIAPASFLELNFEKIEFSVGTASKMDVDVLLSDIKFVGPLSFVETLRDLIPLDGFSDPPSLDITPQGIEAGFSMGLPGIGIGVMSLNNLSLGAGFTVPFIGQPLSVRFNFCTREQPFLLTVYMFGGGGWFQVTIDPHGVQILEAGFEFGAAISVDFGVASGGVKVMAGIYYRMEQDAASLAGYFRLGGSVSVLGLITASIELYLELLYEFNTGKCAGKAQLTIKVSVFLFSGKVTIKCERKFAGANGDPSLRLIMGFRPDLVLDDELALIDQDTEYAWREYCEAFA